MPKPSAVSFKNNPPFERVLIIGFGLLGASFARALKKKALAGAVTVVFRSRISMKRSRSELKGMPFVIGVNPQAIRSADLIVLACPVLQNERWLRLLAKWVKPSCLILDVGSTKESIHRLSLRLGLARQYAACHPMAGSEKKGAQFARADLFEGAICFVAAPIRPDLERLTRTVWNALGAKPVTLNAASHDRLVSTLSHLPHAAAFALALTVNRRSGGKEAFAGNGLKDTTRVAASDAALWTEIFLSNRKHITLDIKELIAQLGTIRNHIARQNAAKLRKLLGSASRWRRGME